MLSKYSMYANENEWFFVRSMSFTHRFAHNERRRHRIAVYRDNDYIMVNMNLLSICVFRRRHKFDDKWYE